jgi:hemoglobin
MRTMTLFEELGGVAAVEKAVEIFYKKVLADDGLAEFFVGVNMKNLKQHQKRFLTLALGGPNDYKGRDMRKAHEHMKLTDKHFDLVLGHLAATLSELGASEQQIATAAKIVEGTRKDVLNK